MDRRSFLKAAAAGLAGVFVKLRLPELAGEYLEVTGWDAVRQTVTFTEMGYFPKGRPDPGLFMTRDENGVWEPADTTSPGCRILGVMDKAGRVVQRGVVDVANGWSFMKMK